MCLDRSLSNVRSLSTKSNLSFEQKQTDWFNDMSPGLLFKKKDRNEIANFDGTNLM